MNGANRLNPATRFLDDVHYKKLYGKNAVVTRLGTVTIVHLDWPNNKEIQRRIKEIMREEINGDAFSDDCPLCRQMQEHPYDVVYYEKRENAPTVEKP